MFSFVSWMWLLKNEGTLAGEDGSKGRTDYQIPKETVLLRVEEGLLNSGWAESQPETHGIETALIAS